MTARELRKQRREADRKARKLEYRQNRIAASAAAGAPEVNFTPDPELLEEFGAEQLAEMMALRARIHADAGIAPAVLREAKIQERPGPTGPRTAAGKATSSGNSLKHGLASGRVIIPGEDPAAFEKLLADLLAEHAPSNETETLLVQQMAQSWWLMQRAIRLQNQAFTETRVDTHQLALFLRYQATHERAFYKALNALTKLKLSRAREQAVSSRRKSDREFVSQSRRATPRTPEFVSQSSASECQNPPIDQAKIQFPAAFTS